ncbi:MAG: ferritin family protein [Acidobacteria bacterium]|nr:ferritin family protein [Acidobacteriota bacterium]MBU4307739.1 ferritin family protein [Acidobacteriota bacterium]MBU4404593.1 ferritin family protein [Acidobacteriota bacterium]MCG2812826.1 ferritin family protein [Candidatus Aminicenantes bacterium]
MNVFDLAMEMEKDGEKYYRQLAEKTNNSGLKNILGMLAEDEVKHFQVLQKLKDSIKVELLSTPILSGSKNIFQQLHEDKNWDDIPVNQIDLYKKAREIETRSFNFYMEKARAHTDPATQKMFFLIAEEEKRHEFLLDHLIQFVSRPQTWLENAEFNHLDQY